MFPELFKTISREWEIRRKDLHIKSVGKINPTTMVINIIKDDNLATIEAWTNPPAMDITVLSRGSRNPVILSAGPINSNNDICVKLDELIKALT